VKDDSSLGNRASISVVVPVYRTTAGLIELVGRVHDALAGHAHEVILVDDGSPSATWSVITQIAAEDDRVIGLRLGRNAGQHSALLAGLRAARFELTVTIDDDLQNPPEEIPKLLEALRSGVDVVYGTPAEVAQRRWRSLSSSVTRGLLASALGAENAARMSSFRAFRTTLRHGFEAPLGPAVSLDALLAWSTSRFSSVVVNHHPRREGTSNYSLRKLIRFAFDTATGYSAAPLQAAMQLGALTAIFGVGVLFWVIGRMVITGESVPGFPFLASIIAIFSGVQLVALGVIGEYLARIHFRVMKKPTFFIAESTSRQGDEEHG
jgi:glycosyltransferase involved in cell wall biosynthesis